MAEKSVVLPVVETGSRMAVIDAIEQDDNFNDRLIELVTFSTRHFSSPRGNATRGSSAAISASDSLDFDSLPSDLTDNLIEVGDKTILCVYGTQLLSGGSCVITPILFDNEDPQNIVSILESKGLYSEYAFEKATEYLLPVTYWDIFGAYWVGLHISQLSTSNEVKIWGYVL